jgi:uncharacterized protein YecT (DUF1311 family)
MKRFSVATVSVLLCLSAVCGQSYLHPIEIRMEKDIDESSSTAVLYEAYENANTAWEAEISNNYHALTALLDNDIARRKLQTAQNAWLAFRDDEMEFSSAYWSLFSGTMYATSSLYYRIYMVRHRTFELACYFNKDYYELHSYFDENQEVKTEEEWDKLLNVNYQALMAKLSQENRTKLRAAQRKLIRYRDTENDCYDSCNLLISNPEHLLLIIRERALRLGKYLEDLDKH